jgi:hypothetical protein
MSRRGRDAESGRPDFFDIDVISNWAAGRR